MKTTIGEQLRQAREKRNITLKEAERITHIRLHFLQELEHDHPELLLSGAQARGFLRLYASFLGLKPRLLLEQLDEQMGIEQHEARIFQGEKKVDESKAKSPQAKSSGFLKKYFRHSEHKKENKSAEKKQQNAIEVSPRKYPVEEGGQQEGKEVPEGDLVTKGNTITSHESEKGSKAAVSRSSQEIFNEIGAAFHTRRENLELTLADIERFTHLKRTYIQAIEEGRFNDLPSTVQGHGMINNYAKFLDLDNDAIMSLYADAIQARRIERTYLFKKTDEPTVLFKINFPKSWRRFLTPDLIVGGVIIIALFAFTLWGAGQIFSSAKKEPTEAPSISQMLQNTSTLTPSANLEETPKPESGEGATQAAAAAPLETIASTPVATVNAAPLQLYIVSHQRAWMRITVDDRIVFEGRTVPENVYTYSGNDQIDLLTGNGAALEVYFNQDYLGELGKMGEVINLSFTLEGMNIPIPTVMPTPEATATYPSPKEGEEEMY